MDTKTSKKKPMRRILIGALVVVVVLVAAVILLLDGIVKAAVEKVAPSILGVPVSLKSVSVRPFAGAVLLKDFVIANPEGFVQSVPLLSAGTVDVDIGLMSLPTDTWILEKLILDKPQFSYDAKGGVFGVGGTSNLKTLIDNIEKNAASEDKAQTADAAQPSGGAQKPEAAADTASPRKYILQLVRISNVQVDVIINGKAVRMTVPDIELKDIGVKEGGVSGAVAGARVTEQVLTQVATAAAKAIADGALKGGDEALKGATNALKGLFSK